MQSLEDQYTPIRTIDQVVITRKSPKHQYAFHLRIIGDNPLVVVLGIVHAIYYNRLIH
jgi:hypothetical protein